MIIKSKAVCFYFSKTSGFHTGSRGYPQNRWPGLPELTLVIFMIIFSN